MRLYSMYFICKNNIEIIKNLKAETVTNNSGQFVRVKGWTDTIKSLNKLANVPGIKEYSEKLYESIPIVLRDRDTFDITIESANKLELARKELLSSVSTIIGMYEQMGLTQNTDTGFDIKLPQFSSIKDFSNCIKDL